LGTNKTASGQWDPEQSVRDADFVKGHVDSAYICTGERGRLRFTKFKTCTGINLGRSYAEIFPANY
jgi:hypothetical protein